MSNYPPAPVRVARPLLVTCALVLAGCSGTLVEYAASPATIPDAALEPRGYVHGNTTELPLTYRVGGAGVSRDITARTWVSGYVRTTAENRTAMLVLYSSPNVEVAGRSVTPVGQPSNRDLARVVLERATDLRGLGGVENATDLRERGARNVTMLGTPTRMVSYAGRAELDGVRVAVVVNVAVVEHGTDIVVALGVHEETIDEAATHAALVERIDHGDGS